jgi:hypothetical protein
MDSSDASSSSVTYTYSSSSSSSSTSKRACWIDYHIINGKDLKRGVAKKADRIREFHLRVNYTRKYYKNKYDARHRVWMKNLAADFDVKDLLAMPLNTVIAFHKVANSPTFPASV